jgi:pyruvate kinase
MVLTEDGESARLISKYRPRQPIFACSTNSGVIRSLNLVQGVIPFKIPSFQGTENLLRSLISTAKGMKLCKKGNQVVCVHSTKEEDPGISNVLKILEVE